MEWKEFVTKKVEKVILGGRLLGMKMRYHGITKSTRIPRNATSLSWKYIVRIWFWQENFLAIEWGIARELRVWTGELRDEGRELRDGDWDRSLEGK